MPIFPRFPGTGLQFSSSFRLYAYRFRSSPSALPVTGRSQRLPLMKVSPPAKVLTVSWQLLPQRQQIRLSVSWEKFARASRPSRALA